MAGVSRARPPDAPGPGEFFSNVRETRLVGIGLDPGIVVFCALFAPLIAPYAPNEQDYLAITEAAIFGPLLGTDDLGRDVLSRIIYGSRSRSRSASSRSASP